MGQGSSDGGVGGLHHLIQSSAPWGSWQEALKGWRNAAGFSGHNWAAPELGRRNCLRSSRLQQPPMVLTEAAGTVASRIGCGILAALAGCGGFLAGLSRMALHGIQGSTFSKSHDALQWKDEWSIPREWKGLGDKDGAVNVPSGCVCDRVMQVAWEV